MFSQRYSKLISACTRCTRRANASSRTHAAYSNWRVYTVEKAIAIDANHGIFLTGTRLFAIPMPSAIASSREIATLNRAPKHVFAPTIQTRFSQELISRNAHIACSHTGASLRCISRGVSSRADAGQGGAVQSVSGSCAKVDDAASVGVSQGRVSQGRFQEEVAQSSDHDSAQIDLGKLISSPSELKGLHASLKTSLRSSGDKQIMSMTIEDIQNILKGEIKRRASQTASVEIWKAMLFVGGLIFVLYALPPLTLKPHISIDSL
jgi:hypothetical protein